MWNGLRKLEKIDADFVSSTTELLQSVSRRIIFLAGGIYLCWYFLGTENLGKLAVSLFPITAIVVLAGVLSLWLVSRQLLAAQAVWQFGLVASITLAAYFARRPEIALSYALLPLMAVLTVGWPAGLLVEGLVIALVQWYSHTAFMPLLPAGYRVAIILGGALAGSLGWTTTRALMTVTQWSVFSSERARVEMEEARDQRMELKQIQEDLIQANRELARLSDRLKEMYHVAEGARRAKEEFVANVSHELRTPLNMIIGFSEMITQSPQVYGGNLSPTLLTDIAAIHLNSQHLAKLVDDVLDLSQVDAGRMVLSKQWVSLEETIDAASLAVRPLFESKDLYLETEVSPDLPQVFCDGTRIRQVVLNLLSNAGRFTEHGGVRVKAWLQGRDAVVSVSDTGPGIDPEDQDRLFEPFQQLDASIRRGHGGSGLGLSISKRFVEMHGGKMWLESEVGAGTTFYFSLPIETPIPASLAGRNGVMRWFSPYQQYLARTRQSKAPVPTVVPRFVVLEEGDTLQRLFTRYVDDTETVAVHDIGEASAELNRSPSRALVVNASPLTETADLRDQLANLPYGTPAVTCWVPGEDEAAKRLGVASYLIKPIARETLLSTVEGLGDGVKTVLLVDDEPGALQLFARVLSASEHGYRVLRARNGRRALSLLRQRHPDAMLLDLIMPGMDGFRVLEEKSLDPSIRDIPVVVISARDPTGEPIVSDTLTVTRGGGFSVTELLACIQSVSEILSPSIRSDDQEQPEEPLE